MCRWCITGTPIYNDLNDLQKFLSILSVDPWTSLKWFKTLITEPCESNCSVGMVLDLLFWEQYHHGCAAHMFYLCQGWDRLRKLVSPRCGGLLWRTPMRDVQRELAIPSKMQHITFTNFNRIEAHFYDSQHTVRALPWSATPPELLPILTIRCFMPGL